MDDAGFYTTPDGTFAANLESVEESSEEAVNYTSGENLTQDSSRANVQHLAALLLLLLAMGELAYLQWTGEI
jgi:hypothetical protein